MTVRTIGVTAAIGMIVSVAAQADPPGGDIVDQILYPSPPPATAPSPTPVLVQPTPPAAPVAAAPPAPIAAQPVPLTPQNAIASGDLSPSGPPPRAVTTTLQPASTLTGPDIIGDAQPAMPLPAPPPLASRWQGFYVGTNIGGGWDEGTASSTCTNSLTNSPSGCVILNEGGPNGSGILGGGQVGYLTHFDLGTGTGTPLMVGFESDAQGSGISGSQNIGSPIPLAGFAPCPDCTFTARQSINWFGTARLRVGIPIDNLLIYATGGLIYGELQAAQRINLGTSGANYSANVTTNHMGPTVGAGAELLVSGPWSVKVETLYYDLGKIRTVAAPMNGAFVNFSNTKSFVYRGGIIRLGINLHLGDLIY
jgi:outer membrane immunogenic protein